MDEVIRAYPYKPFGDNLNLCDIGIAYQVDTSSPIEYGKEYFQNYIGREDTQIAKELNNFRTSITEKYCKCVLDMGIGSGEFIKKSKIKAYGFDINHYGVEWLKERNIFINPYEHIPEDVDGITLWDTLEHIEKPTEILDLVRQGMYVFISLPIFDNFDILRQSKHFKENEHFLYFSEKGLVTYFVDCGFELLEWDDAETKAGREGVLSFVFRKK